MELQILDFIQQNMRTGFGDAVLPVVTHFGDSGIGWIILAAVLAIIPKTRKLGFSIAVGLFLELLVCDITVKPLVARPRPFMINPDVSLITKAPHGFSFPSGHTGASFVAISALLTNKSKLWIPALCLGIIIAFSRMYLYFHYPTDILGGVIIGSTLGFAGAMLVNKLYEMKSNG